MRKQYFMLVNQFLVEVDWCKAFAFLLQTEKQPDKQEQMQPKSESEMGHEVMQLFICDSAMWHWCTVLKAGLVVLWFYLIFAWAKHENQMASGVFNVCFIALKWIFVFGLHRLVPDRKEGLFNIIYLFIHLGTLCTVLSVWIGIIQV